MKKRKYELEDFTGAIAVLENYLDGAVADYEQGILDNTGCIWASIRTIELLYEMYEPMLNIIELEYRERMRVAGSKEFED